jgi:hypothetical protein
MPFARRIAAVGLLWTAVAGFSVITSSASADSKGPIATEQRCAAPVVGQISCDAQILVSGLTHRPLHPKPRKVARRQVIAHIAAAQGISAPDTMTPDYLQQAYDLTYLSANRGSGDTVAAVAIYDDPAAESDLSTFRSTYGLPPCTTADGCFQQLNEEGQTSPLPAYDSGWAQEESMDLDAISSICPNCKIDLVEADAPDPEDLQTAITSAINAGANQVSISGAGEFAVSPFTDFSAPGVSILAAAGDDGVVPEGLANYPAALPYVTAVGGTSLEPDTASSVTPRGVFETAWSDSGAGCDTQEPPLPYQPAVGCDGRMYSDISADADPSTGLTFYDSQAGGWLDGGGTSLATPIAAAFEAVTGVDGSTPQWAYNDESNLNDPMTGSTGSCYGQIAVLCDAGVGYSGPTGAGSISGQVVDGAPGIGEPSFGSPANPTYTKSVKQTSAQLVGGCYPNGEATAYYWQYGTSKSYGSQTTRTSIPAGTDPVAAGAHLTGLQAGTAYHYRLVAVNTSGTTDGYDYSFKTSGRAAVARAKPASLRRRAKPRRRDTRAARR